eukprot:scaffold10845_cov103-Skeletonema_dohrnii-CCMP3373.AAC.4
MQQSTTTCRAQPRQVDDGERVRPEGERSTVYYWTVHVPIQHGSHPIVVKCLQRSVLTRR